MEETVDTAYMPAPSTPLDDWPPFVIKSGLSEPIKHLGQMRDGGWTARGMM